VPCSDPTQLSFTPRRAWTWQPWFVCGTSSAIGLNEVDRADWPQLRERLRQPDHLMALIRGVLAGDEEVAAVAAVTPAGIVRPLAILVTPAIEDELDLGIPTGDDRTAGHIGDYEVEVLLDAAAEGEQRAIAVLMTPWIFENLVLFSRKLWSRR
jgi:hypothetical protein